MSFPNNYLEAIAWEHAKQVTPDKAPVNDLFDNYTESLKEVTKHCSKVFPDSKDKGYQLF